MVKGAVEMGILYDTVVHSDEDRLEEITKYAEAKIEPKQTIKQGVYETMNAAYIADLTDKKAAAIRQKGGLN